MLLAGCEWCGIKYFFEKEEKDFHLLSSRHRSQKMNKARQVSYHPHSAPVKDISKVLSEFRHRPLIGQHFCLGCGLTVTTNQPFSLEAVSGELYAHLMSKEHKHIRLLSQLNLDCQESAELAGQLPIYSIALSESNYVCFACSPFLTFSSFVSLCEHSSILHHTVSQKSRKRSAPESTFFSGPLPLFMTENDDGMSRTCTLCNVIVWSDEDPHLLGKRHKKSIRNHFWSSSV